MTPEGFIATIDYDTEAALGASWRYRVIYQGRPVSSGWCNTFSFAAYIVENVLHRVLSEAAA